MIFGYIEEVNTLSNLWSATNCRLSIVPEIFAKDYRYDYGELYLQLRVRNSVHVSIACRLPIFCS